MRVEEDHGPTPRVVPRATWTLYVVVGNVALEAGPGFCVYLL